MSEYVNTREAAEIKNVSYSTVTYWIRTGKVKAIRNPDKFNGYLISKADLSRIDREPCGRKKKGSKENQRFNTVCVRLTDEEFKRLDELSDFLCCNRAEAFRSAIRAVEYRLLGI